MEKGKLDGGELAGVHELDPGKDVSNRKGGGRRRAESLSEPGGELDDDARNGLRLLFATPLEFVVELRDNNIVDVIYF
jgi:hypothetical protein